MNRKLSPFWLLFILTGLNLFNYMDRSVLSAVRTPMAAGFSIGYEDSARAFTAFMIGYFVTSPIFGYLGDRFPRKWLIAVGIFVWSLGTLLTGFAGTFGMLIAYRAVVGVGEASYMSTSPGLISDAYGPKWRNNAMTIFFAAQPVGLALGYAFGGEMADHVGWRYAFVWAGAPGLLLALVLLPFKEPERGAADASAGPPLDKPKISDLFKLFRDLRYQLVVWGYVAYTFALGAFAFWAPTFMEKVHGLPNKEANNFFGLLVVVAGFVGTLAGGFLASAWHKRNPAGYAWVLTLSIFAAVPFSVAALMVHGRIESMAFLSVAILLLFLATGPANTLIIETVPINLRSSAMALSIFMLHLFGDLYSSQLVGWLADRWHDLQKATLILPAALFVGGIFWLFLALVMRRPPQKPAA